MSQTGDLESTATASTLELRLVDKPIIHNIHPTHQDALSASPQVLQIRGENFLKDGGLPAGTDNIKCTINKQLAELRYHNNTFIECTLVPTLGVQSYVVALSINFG